jgi:hypothetical protein
MLENWQKDHDKQNLPVKMPTWNWILQHTKYHILKANMNVDFIDFRTLNRTHSRDQIWKLILEHAKYALNFQEQYESWFQNIQTTFSRAIWKLISEHTNYILKQYESWFQNIQLSKHFQDQHEVDF